MPRLWILLAALAGLFAVASGAIGTHAMRGDVRAAMLLGTGAQYGMYHALALLALALLALREEGAGSRFLAVAGWCFVGGILLFSGSLSLLALTGAGFFGALTPVGGVLFLLGWVALALYALRLTRR